MDTKDIEIMRLHNGRLQKDKVTVKPDLHEGQFHYLGRWVDKHSFRAFVYDKNGNEKLADSYEEFRKLTTSGIWFESKLIAKEIDSITKEEVSKSSLPKEKLPKEPDKQAVISLKDRKKKDGTICTTS